MATTPNTVNIDHEADLKKYVPNADSAKVKAIMKHLGIALKSRDGSTVAATSKDELDRVRESWLKKKLGLTQPDAELDKGIKEIAERMKADRNKSRVAFYYMLAEKYGKLASL
jgi:hypothetical protein